MKNSMRWTMFTVIGTLVLAGLVGVARADNPPPTRLATINLVKVFDALNEKIAGDQDIDALNKKLSDDRAKLEGEVRKIDAGMKEFKQGSPEFKLAAEELLKKGMELQSFSAYVQQKLMLERRLKTTDLYRKMNQAIESYAIKNGVALVMVVDELDLSNVRTNEELLSRITMRKVMYAHATLDISEKIVEVMNTEFKMGK